MRVCIPPTIRRCSTFSRRSYHRMFVFGRSCRVSADPAQGPHTCGWNRCSDTQACCRETYRGSYTRACRGGTVATEDQLGPCCAAQCASTATRDTHHSFLWKNWPVVLDPRPRLYEKRHVSPTNGFADVQANRPFAIRVANFGASERTLAKNQILGFGNPAPDTVFQVDLPEDDFSRQSAERVCADEISLSHSEESPVSETDGDAKRGASFRDALLELPMHSGVTTRVKEPERPPSVDDLDFSHFDKKLQRLFRKCFLRSPVCETEILASSRTPNIELLCERMRSRFALILTGPAQLVVLRSARPLLP